MRKRIAERFSKTIITLEAWLAVFIILAVILASVNLFKIVGSLMLAPSENVYGIFHELLGQILLLLIGLELVIMLLRHTPASVLEVLIFAVARKVLIEAQDMVSVFWGILSIAVVFIILKHLYLPKTLETECFLCDDDKTQEENNV